MSGDSVDFFISHAGADRAWAEWVAWQLMQAGYSVELDVWDWPTGRNFLLALSDALDRCDRVVALFSSAYFDRSRYTTEEWTSAVLHVPGAEEGRLVPVRVEEVSTAQVPAALRTLIYRDLFGMGEDQARRVLLDAAAGPRRPDSEPMFPDSGTSGNWSKLGDTGPRLPESIPRIWNLPARNPAFTGRDGLLVAVREALLTEDRAVVRALHGMGGVGKTQLAAEYAYRFAGTYDLAWWVNAEQAGLIGEQIAALGMTLGCVEAGAETEAVRAAVLAELRVRERWLLIFDNAQTPADVAWWLPGGGHVLITSRERGWDEVAVSVEVNVLAREESAALLRTRTVRLTDVEADRLADELGDLPLAIAQAAGFMAETGMPAAQYLDLLRTRATDLLNQGTPGLYPRSLAATTQLIIDRLAEEDPAAAELASLCAFLAPEPIPLDLFTVAAKGLPTALTAQADDPLAWRLILGQLGRQSLARIDHRGLQMHRLTQAILRDRLTPEQAVAARASTEALLAASNPRNPDNPTSWSRWAQLMPHLLAADLAATDNLGLRWMACSACWYLLARGDTPAAHGLARDLREQWQDRLSGNDVTVLEAAHYLNWALREMGRLAEAQDLAQDTLDRARRVLGRDHPYTLTYASEAAIVLHDVGEVQAARDLAQDTLDRRRRVLGADHENTLRSAGNLARDLSALGDLQAARDLNQDTLERMRRVMGVDHPDTLGCARNLATELHELGELQAARDLDQDTVDRLRRVLGEDHPQTLFCAWNLATDLHELGELQATHDLAQDTLERMRRVLGENDLYTQRLAETLATEWRVPPEPDDDP